MRTLVTSCTVTRRPAGNMGTQRRCCFQEIACHRREPAGSCSSALGEATRRRQGNEFSYSHISNGTHCHAKYNARHAQPRYRVATVTVVVVVRAFFSRNAFREIKHDDRCNDLFC